MTHPLRDAFLRLIEYQLWGDFPDRFGAEGTATDDGATTSAHEDRAVRLVLPFDLVAAFRGVSPTTHAFSAERILRLFEEAVWPLGFDRTWRYTRGRSRTISTRVPEAVEQLLARQRADAPEEQCRFFVSGTRCTRHQKEAVARARREWLRGVAALTPQNHPGMPYLELFNGGMSQRMIGLLVARSLTELEEARRAMPSTTPGDQRRKRRVGAILHTIRDFPELWYRGTWRSPRIFPIGLTVLSLPKRMRNLVFRGTTKLDMRSCQLGIVAALWDVPRLRAFLGGERGNIWQELAARARMDPERHKPVIKRAVFSVVFGMNERTVRTRLCEDRDEGRLDEPVTAIQADALMSHPLVCDLLAARSQMLRRISGAGGMEDCFGNWHAVRWSKHPGLCRDPCSVLSAVVQAVEMDLLLSVLPVLSSERSASLVATIHDGFVVKLTESAEAARITRRLRAALHARAAQLDVPVELVEEV